MPFYVALPSPTIDFTVSDGIAEIPIEQRGAEEQSTMTGRTADGRIETVQIVPDGSAVANYGFDVTPARLVTGLITERGVLKASREGLTGGVPGARGRRPMMRGSIGLPWLAFLLGHGRRRRRRPRRSSRSSTAPSATSPARSSSGSGWSTSIPAPATRRACKAVGAIAIEELQKLGAAIETVSATPAVGDNIVASFTGSGKGKVLLMAHMDTVFAKGTAAARPFRIEGGRAYGPGRIGRQGRHRRRDCRC